MKVNQKFVKNLIFSLKYYIETKYEIYLFTYLLAKMKGVILIM